MNKILLFLSALISFAMLTPEIQETENKELADALLWRISGNGLESSSYMYGTMHIGDSRILQYGDSVPMALNEVDAVYGEIDLTDIVGQMAAMKDMVMTGTTLKELVSEKDYKMIKARLEGTAVGLMIDNIKPFFTMGNVAMLFFPQDEISIIDMHLLEQGKALKKEVGGLETIQEQLAVVETLTLKEQAEMLVEMCRDFDEQKQVFKEMYEAYLKEDLNKLVEIGEEEMEDLSSAEFEDKLLEKRNVIMADRLNLFMKSKSIFYAVGALHLPGENGLIKLLENHGYTVEPIISNRPELAEPGATREE